MERLLSPSRPARRRSGDTAQQTDDLAEDPHAPFARIEHGVGVEDAGEAAQAVGRYLEPHVGAGPFERRQGVARGQEAQVEEGAVLRRRDDVRDEDILSSSGILLGSPVHRGSLSAESKSFLDRVGQVLVDAKELGPGSTPKTRSAGAFVTGGAISSGKELARLAILAAFLNMRFVVVGGEEADAFGNLGAQATTAGGDPGLSEAELEEAFDRWAEGIETVIRGRDLEPVEFALSLPGEHNRLNAACALAALEEAGVTRSEAEPTLADFTGVGRRLEFRGETARVRLYDDYGHHPSEIAATLDAARTLAGDARVLALFQPHLYSRTVHLAHELGAGHLHVVVSMRCAAGAAARWRAALRAVRMQPARKVPSSEPRPLSPPPPKPAASPTA